VLAAYLPRTFHLSLGLSLGVLFDFDGYFFPVAGEDATVALKAWPSLFSTV